MATTMSDVMTAWRARRSTEEVCALIERMDPNDPDTASAQRWRAAYDPVSRSVAELDNIEQQARHALDGYLGGK